jgi:parvulin-like peptidyl-prolyl isomerase
MMRTMSAVAVVLGLVGCPGSKEGPTITTKPAPVELGQAVSPVVSSDILAREPVANRATVKHILISWNDLAEAFAGHIDPRATKRSKADAEAEVRALLKQLADGADFDAMMKASSEDQGSALGAREYVVTPDATLVIEFRQLSLRLKPGEVGVCQSDFGFHIIKRFS